MPANTTAALFVPTSAPDESTEDTTFEEEATKETFLRQEEGGIVFEVEAGTYQL